MKKLLFKTVGMILFTSLVLLGCKHEILPEEKYEFGPEETIPYIDNRDENNTSIVDSENINNDQQTTVIPIKNNIKFNTSNARTLALVENQNSSYRSMSRVAENPLTNAMIVKIMEDGSIENFMEIPEGCSIAQIEQIYQSPYENSKEIYIRFNFDSGYYETVTHTEYWTDEYGNKYESYSWNEEEFRPLFGQIICIKPDGSYYDILKKSDGSYKYFFSDIPLAFDSSNGMYFIGTSDNDSSSSIIYRFDPTVGQTVALTPAVPNTKYKKLQVTGDGQWLFVEGTGPASSFLKAIPVISPDNAINIEYKSDTNGVVYNWLYNETSKCLYYIATKNYDYHLYKIPYENGTFNVSKKIDYSTEIPYSLNLIENRIEYQWPETNYGYDVTTKAIDYENSKKVYNFRISEDSDVINYQEILDYYKSKIYSWLTYDAILTFNPNDYEIRFDTIIENLQNGNIAYNVYQKNDIENFIEKVQNKKELDLIKTIVDEDLFYEMNDYITNSAYYRISSSIDGDYIFKNCLFADILYEKNTNTKINSNLFNKNENNFFLNADYYANSNSFSSVWTFNSEYDSDKGYYVDVKKVMQQQEGFDFENINIYYPKNYKSFYLYNKDTNQINATEIVNLMKYYAYYYMVENKKNDFDANDYEIRFDYFKNIEGYEKLATKTKGKVDEEAIKIISNNNELMYLFYKVFNRIDYNVYAYTNIYKEILYKKGTNQKINKSFFPNNDYPTFNDFILTKTPYLISYKDDEFDPTVLLDSLATACGKTRDEITFSLEFFANEDGYEDLYTTLKDEDAIEFLNENSKLELLLDYIKPRDYNNYSYEYSEIFSCNSEFLKNTCFKKGTTQTAYTAEGFNGYFDYIWESQLFQSNGQSLYYLTSAGTNRPMQFFELYNKDGEHTGKNLASIFGDSKIVESKYSNSGLCLKVALTIPGTQDETGKHQLYFYDVNTDKVTNLFNNLAQKENYEIYSYSIGAEKVYFNAVCGMSLIVGNIDIQTGILSQNNTTLKLSQIISLH